MGGLRLRRATTPQTRVPATASAAAAEAAPSAHSPPLDHAAETALTATAGDGDECAILRRQVSPGLGRDTAPYSVQREIEDIEALIDDAGGSAHVVGFSSGAALALQAAAALGGKVTKPALYEAPYSDADGAAAEWRGLTAQVDALLAEDRPEDAITRFMAFVGAPAAAVAGMKASRAWPGMLAMAPTLAYDNAVLGDDRPVPVAVAARIQARTLVLDGSESLKPGIPRSGSGEAPRPHGDNGR